MSIVINYSFFIEKHMDKNATYIALCDLNFWNYHSKVFKHSKKLIWFNIEPTLGTSERVKLSIAINFDNFYPPNLVIWVVFCSLCKYQKSVLWWTTFIYNIMSCNVILMYWDLAETTLSGLLLLDDNYGQFEKIYRIMYN